MENELASTRAIAEHLRGLGYALVQTEARLPDAPRLRVDVLAWAPDDTGELVPRLAIEIKHTQRPESALPLLAQVRASLGTVEHYAVTNEAWFRAGYGLRTLEQVPGPSPLTGRLGGELKSVHLATELLQQRIWKNANRREQDGELGRFVDAVSVDSNQAIIETANGDVVAVDPTVLWRARRAVLADMAERDRFASFFVSPPAVSVAIASLAGNRLGGTVLDPFCGSGSFLWALQERATHEGRMIEAIGRDVNPSVIKAASLIGQTAPTKIVFDAGDAFATALPRADVIVTAPPMGLRLGEPYELQIGTSTRHADIAAVDVCLRALKPGGRAVFQLAPHIAFQAQAETYREYLAKEYRVAALIGCPSGSAYGTKIQTVLMVVDKAPAGDTFVAQLSADWETQLAPTGPAMASALAHIDGITNGAR
ncbi:HsdM family class I SAM-dependent methyltransferase [Arthrobacter subterraneus]|uniref:HsdM family class I SAM-dependent methyltransferase n=1 Tax=Arthrobacter subterraneus TaxID=335973 RepID=UPI00380BE35A